MTHIDPDCDFANQARFLSHVSNVSRLKIVLMLRGGEQSVGSLAGALPMSSGGVSQHLARMREAGIVGSRREGQTIYYRLVSEEANALVSCAMESAEKRENTVPGTPRNALHL